MQKQKGTDGSLLFIIRAGRTWDKDRQFRQGPFLAWLPKHPTRDDPPIGTLP
jgi:hypothetical protein